MVSRGVSSGRALAVLLVVTVCSVLGRDCGQAEIDARDITGCVTVLHMKFLGHQGAIWLGDALHHGPDLEILDLHHTRIGDDDAFALAAGLHNSVKDNAVGECVLEAVIQLNRPELLASFLLNVPQVSRVKDKHIAQAFQRNLCDAVIDALVASKPTPPTAEILAQLVNRKSTLSFEDASAPYDRAVQKLGLAPSKLVLQAAVSWYVTRNADGTRNGGELTPASWVKPDGSLGGSRHAQQVRNQKPFVLSTFYTKNDLFAKTGSGQT